MTFQRIVLIIMLVTALGNAVMMGLNHRKFVAWDRKMQEATAEYQHAMDITNQTIAHWKAATASREQWEALLAHTSPCQGL
jgi:hypothetical protein